jgi:hypothetical protein
MYHTKVVDYMTETKPADFATLVIKGMPTALITEMNKASSNIESLADKAASKTDPEPTDPELNPQKRDRGTYCVWAHPKDTNQTKLSLSPTKCALPAKVVADQHRAPNGYEKARPMLYVDRAGQRELLPPALQASSIG